jgi:hypothetical protein
VYPLLRSLTVQTSARLLACGATLASLSGCSLVMWSEPGKTVASDEDAGSDAGQDDADAGDGGVGCRTAADCTPASDEHEEVVCDVQTGRCLQLTSDACPVVLGEWKTEKDPDEDPMVPDEEKTDPRVLVLGATSPILDGNPSGHAATLNYLLAIEELTAVGGVPAGPGDGLAKPLLVVCDFEQPDAALAHLVDELHVPGFISTFDARTLGERYEKLARNDVFTLNALQGDPTLTAREDEKGLFWHLLGSSSDLPPTYTRLFARLEPLLRSRLGLSGSTPLRVATITGDASLERASAQAVMEVLRWNDKSSADNLDGQSYLPLMLPSTLSGHDVDDIDTTEVVDELFAYDPHVVVSFGSHEFYQALQRLELKGARPFYVLGPYNSKDPDILAWVDTLDHRRERVAGITLAEVADSRVLDAYEQRFRPRFNDPEQYLGQENFYDAVYFLVYAAVGGGDVALTGRHLGQGMLRLTSGVSFDMGPRHIGDITGALGAPTGSVSLQGTLGPPNFHLGTGARRGLGSVYCVGEASETQAQFVYDVLIHDGSDANNDLTGTFPCFEGLSP